MKPLFFRFPKTGASFMLALSLLACTENKSAPTPTPVPPASTPAAPTPTTPAATNSEARDYNQYTELIWGDEFDGSAVDQTKWGYDLGGNGWGNNELEYYTNSTDNAYVTGGNLVIEAKKQSQGGRDYTSARMLTKGKQDFTFGRIDVRAKLPKGQGVWPAIWMLGSDIDQNNWPKCGEIDIMELRGQDPTKVLSTMHFPNSAGAPAEKGTETRLPNSASFADDFHVFSVVRSQNQMRFFIDNQQYYTFTNSDTSIYPFNTPFFMVLNVAVGGNFLGNPDASTVFPQKMLVDYVRYYQYK